MQVALEAGVHPATAERWAREGETTIKPAAELARQAAGVTPDAPDGAASSAPTSSSAPASTEPVEAGPEVGAAVVGVFCERAVTWPLELYGHALGLSDDSIAKVARLKPDEQAAIRELAPMAAPDVMALLNKNEHGGAYALAAVLVLMVGTRLVEVRRLGREAARERAVVERRARATDEALRQAAGAVLPLNGHAQEP